jgi:ribose transport system ATP-binding protein
LVGSGRTALARGIFGAESLPRAQIELKGRAMLIRSTRQAIRAGIGMVPEDRKTQGLILDRSVSDNITLPILGRLSLGPLVRRGVIRDLVSQLIRSFDIRVYSMGQTARTLSGGNQQKVTLAKWVASECDVLILDEPTRGVDVGARTEIYNLIGQLVQKGKGILLISSDLPEVLGLSDRIIVVYGGCLVTEFSRRDAVAETVIRYASGTFQE